MSQDPKVVRILLIGESRVGKTSLILSLVSEEFPPKVPAQAEEITIPGDVTPEHIPTQIVDYSPQVQTHEQLCNEIIRANVICLVHALDDENSFKQITAFWLPLIRHNNFNRDTPVPVILVGNKLDLNRQSKLDQMLPIMSEFTEVETCIECSAKTMLNLSETFWFAQKAVLYPTAPLYNVETKELTPGCVRALIRIFRICDFDNDGYLSDRELEAFQTRCFSIPLTTQSLSDVKRLVKQSCPGGFTLNGLTQKGFLFLHLTFIQKGRHETTWTVLRQFGYDNNMCLSEAFINPKISIPNGCSTEVSHLGYQFLNTIFNKYDLDRDNCLSPNELNELLATCPEQQLKAIIDQMNVCVNTNRSGWITRQGFLAFWTLTAYLEPNRLLEYFAYLGFNYFISGSNWHSNTTMTGHSSDPSSTIRMVNGVNLLGFDKKPYSKSESILLPHRSDTKTGNFVDHVSVDSASPSIFNLLQNYTSRIDTVTYSNELLLKSLIITSDKRLDNIRHSTQRIVFYCRVYGDRKVGKTCLLQGLLGRSLHNTGGYGIGGLVNRTSKWVAACGLPIYGQSRSLIMQEISAQEGEHMSATEALSADVACLVYDVSNPDSFRYVANLFLNFYRGTRVPCLFVAAKSDQPCVVQSYQIDPNEMACKYHLPPPEPFSSMHVNQNRINPLVDDHENNFANGELSEYHRRAGSAEPSNPPTTSGTGLSRNRLSAQDLIKLGTSLVKDIHSPRSSRSRNHSRSDLYSHTMKTAGELNELDFPTVYLLLCTMANYPHHRGLELAHTDYAWKWTLAATILAGFGFFAFRMAKTHL